MTEFEDGLNRMRKWQTVADEADALVVIAEGLAELVELLRPVSQVLTAKPEPLVLRSQNMLMPCLAGEPASNGFRRCMEPYGHDGDHVHQDRLAGTVRMWTQRHRDVPKPCGAEFTGGTDTAPRSVLCVRHRGHEGRHMDAVQVYGPGAHMDADTSGVTW